MQSTSDEFALRPFYFVVVVWGDQYRNYFLEYCLPSLLASRNIPALAGQRPAKYLIATTTDDWRAMNETAIFRELERYVRPVFIELPPCPADRPYWMQNIVGHRLCCDLIFQHKAYRIFTSPDSIASDGTIARLHELAASGVEAVFKLTVPTAETKTFFRTLAEMSLLPEKSARDTGSPLVYSGRQLAAATLRAMHQMSAVNEWEASHFCGYASTPWWSVPNEEGIVAFGGFWDILLIDYAAVKIYDSTILDDRGWDGDYILKTVGDFRATYLVRDTDEINFAGWNSLPWTPLARVPHGELGKGAAFRASFYRKSWNSLHRRLAFFPTRIHAAPLTRQWSTIEKKALHTLLTWLDTPSDLEAMRQELPPRLRDPVDMDAQIAACRPRWWHRSKLSSRVYLAYIATRTRLYDGQERAAGRPRFFGLLNSLPIIWPALHVSRIAGRRCGLLIIGDAGAIRWWKWRLRKAAADLTGRTFVEPRPNPPD